MACAALKSSTGGWLHVHGNVSSYAGHVGICTSGHSEGEESWRNQVAENNPWEMEEEASFNVDVEEIPGPRMSSHITCIACSMLLIRSML